jgi:hypothetical protein
MAIVMENRLKKQIHLPNRLMNVAHQTRLIDTMAKGVDVRFQYWRRPLNGPSRFDNWHEKTAADSSYTKWSERSLKTPRRSGFKALAQVLCRTKTSQ